jgi:cytidylate kinase
MLTVEHCLRRAERFRMSSFVAENVLIAMRLRDIADNYRRMADLTASKDAFISAPLTESNWQTKSAWVSSHFSHPN